MKTKRTLAWILVIALLLPLFGLTDGKHIALAEGEEPDPQTMSYEIYPIPHKLEYGEGSAVLKDSINLILEDGLDTYTKAKAKKVLEKHGYTVVEATEIKEGETNLIVGINGSEGVADTYFKNQNIILAEDFLNKIDAHCVEHKNGTIAVLGIHTDAAFYGLATVDLLLSQIPQKTLRNLHIEDYANHKTRGFIEGYYGIPWSVDDRASLMEFAETIKGNTYVFGPKDDPYLRARWYEQYPEDKLPDIARLAKLGNETKVRYVWTVSPFIGETRSMWSNDYEDAKNKILAKFDALYESGVRQFGVFADDVGSLPNETVSRLINDIEAWKATKEEKILDTIFCPGAYNFANWAYGDGSELTYFDEHFPKSVEIFWTGDYVCAPVTQSTINHFKTGKSWENVNRRDPLFWLNWPVNDVDGRSPVYRLAMGKATMLENNIQNLVGVVSNPMQQAEASKNAIFAICDYTWNSQNFDVEKSWNAGFHYFEPNAPEDLREMCKHMSNMDTMGDVQASGSGVPGMPESEEFAQFITAFDNGLGADQATAKAALDVLVAEYNKIITARENFIAKSKNENLKTEIAPFIDSLRDLCNASIKFAQAKYEAKYGNKDTAKATYLEGMAEWNKVDTHSVPHLTGTDIGPKVARVANKRLRPAASRWRNQLENELGFSGEDPVTEPFKDPDVKPEMLVTEPGTWETYQHYSTGNMMDKNDKTFTWFVFPEGGKFDSGHYFGYNFGEVKRINRVRLGMGNGDKDADADHWTDYIIRIKDANGNWHELTEVIRQGTKNFKVTDLDLSENEILATAIIVENRAECNSWLKVSDFMVDIDSPGEDKYTVTFDITPADATLKVTNAGNIEIVPKTGKTYELSDGTYSYWIYKGGYKEELGQFTIDGENPENIVINLKESKAFVNPMIKEKHVVVKPSEYWSYEMDVPNRLAHMFDGDDTTPTIWSPPQTQGEEQEVGDRIGYDFGKVMKVDKIHLMMGDLSAPDDHFNNYVIKYSKANKPWSELTDADFVALTDPIDQTTPILTTDLEDLKIEARFVVVENGLHTRFWPRISEFDVSTEEIEVQVDKTKLQAKIAEANKINLEDKTEASANALRKAIADGQKVYDNINATQEQVDNTIMAINKAIQGLKEKPVEQADKSKLQARVEEAEALDLNGMTEESKKVLTDAIAKAKGILQDPAATQETVDFMLSELNDAIRNLKDIEIAPEVDKEALREKIAKAEAVDTTGKTDATAAVLRYAIRDAKEVLANEEASVTEVNEAIQRLDQAMNNLIAAPKPVDKTELEKRYNELKDTDLSNKTDLSALNFRVALNIAEKALLDPDPTQVEIEEALRALNLTYSLLKDKEPAVKHGFYDAQAPLKGKIYFEKGKQVFGWHEINGYKFYFREGSGTMVTGWQFIDGYWRYFRTSGTMVTSRWEWLGKKWKFFNSKGESMNQFWEEDGKVWLSQAGPNTNYYKGWITLEGHRYFFRMTSGSRVEGWQHIDGAWRYFCKGSGSLAYGWQFIDGAWYYLREKSGTRVTGRQFIDGKWHEFGADGKLKGSR